MLLSKAKNNKTRKSFNRLELDKKISKFLFINLLNTRNTEEKKVFLRFFLKHVKNSKTKLNYRCIETARSKGVYRPFGFSRSYFKELLQFGVIPGYTKSVW